MCKTKVFFLVYKLLFGSLILSTVALDEIPYIDHPTIIVNRHESHDMPFRYVKNSDGDPVMPEGMVDLIKKDAEKAIDDLL